MKQNFFLYLIIAVLFGVVLYGAYNKGRDVEKRIWQQKYDLDISQANFRADSLDGIVKRLLKDLDSLKNIPAKIIVEYKERQAEIDSTLASDSTQAIPLYRNGLSELDVIPDETPILTNREVGLGAGFFLELKTKRELLFSSYDLQLKQEDIIDKLRQANKELIKENTLLRLKPVVRDEESIWNHRFPLIIGGGVGYDIDRKQIGGSVGVYWGVRIGG